MASNSSSGSSGIGFFGLLAVLFIGLKLTDHIDWSWWWVLSPLWLPVTLVIVGFLVMFLVVACILAVSSCVLAWMNRR